MSIFGPRRVFISFKKYLKTSIKFSSTKTIKKSSTLDLKDVEYHSNLGEFWWDENGRMKGLHAYNPLRVQFIRNCLANVGLKEVNPGYSLDGIKILDVGCGGGLLSEQLAKIGATVTGLDASSQLISVAEEHAKLDKNISGRLSYIASTIEDYSRSNPAITYDVIVASEIIEHVADQELFLKSCSELLKPGGSIFITTPNKTFSSWLLAIILVEYILAVIPRGTHDWNKFIPPQETKRLLEKYGCETKLIHGIGHNPFKIQWFWSSSTSLFYALYAIKGANHY